MNQEVFFDEYCNEARAWLIETARRLDCQGRPDWAYRALKAVLHTLRDRTPMQEVFHLSAQLPIMIRGIYLEGYRPVGRQEKMDVETFVQRIRTRMGPGVEISPLAALRAVLGLLYDRTSVGEMDDIRGTMPSDIRELWDSLLPEKMIN